MSGAAPFYRDVAGGPDTVETVWTRAEDGVRLRVALWAGGTRGTAIILPGRTEFVEKYAGVAGRLRDMGLASAAIDWRGQGLSDRAHADRMLGDVGDFAEYQLDTAALLDLARDQGLPEPWHLLSHSMGGCIALRALIKGIPDRFAVRSAVFSAPMWGILTPPVSRPVAYAFAYAAVRTGQGHRYSPTTSPVNYIHSAPVEGNLLTSDPDMFAHMREMTERHPDLSLGGPSLRWLLRGLQETAALAQLPSPDIPALTLLGDNERLVEAAPVQERMANWPGGVLQVLPGGEHEVLMEAPAIRDAAFAAIRAHVSARSADPGDIRPGASSQVS